MTPPFHGMRVRDPLAYLLCYIFSPTPKNCICLCTITAFSDLRPDRRDLSSCLPQTAPLPLGAIWKEFSHCCCFFYKFFRYICFFLGNYSNNKRRVNNARLGDNVRGTYIFQHCTKIVGTITKWALETKSALHVMFAVHFAQIGLAQLKSAQLSLGHLGFGFGSSFKIAKASPGPGRTRPGQTKGNYAKRLATTWSAD